MSVVYEIGNTYQAVPRAQAKHSRNGHPKVHDWTLYVDIVEGNADAIDSVTFDLGEKFNPPSYRCCSPTPVSTFTGQRAMRFQTRQQSSAQRGVTSRMVKVEVQARNKTTIARDYSMKLRTGGSRGSPRQLDYGYIKKEDFKTKALPEKGDFGLELELSCGRENVESSKEHLVRQHAGWKFVYDGSLACNRNNPNCTKFELVSPIMRGPGNSGMTDVKRVVNTVHNAIGSIQVNKSMGFHVHVSVAGFTVKQLIKICQNYIKYEAVIDTFMAVSRRGGGRQAINTYCQSNRDMVPGSSNKSKHLHLQQCRSLDELSDAMNPEGRYYKLNLQNLITGRQPTIEFRQHSSTANYAKIRNWILFCFALTHNSAKLAAPSSLRQSRSLDDQFDMLFWYCIKDRGLRDYYKRRQEEFQGHEEEPCCDDCAHGNGSCSRRHRRRK